MGWTVVMYAVFHSCAYNRGVQEMSLNPSASTLPYLSRDFLLATQGKDMSHCNSSV